MNSHYRISKDGTVIYTNSKERIHNVKGPAIIFRDGECWFYIDSIRLNSKDEWFAALTQEEKENYIWNLNE